MVINSKLNILILILLALLPRVSWAQDDAFSLLGKRPQRLSTTINRKALVRRHNPTTHHVGREQYLLGESSLFFHVDATGLQTFLPDTKSSLNVGLNFADTTRISNLDMTLDRWMGKADSRFRHNGRYFHVETVCAPSYNTSYMMVRPTFATRITSDSIFEVRFYASQEAAAPTLSVTKLKNHAAICIANITEQGTRPQWYTVSWRGNASLKKRGNGLVLYCKGNTVRSEGKKVKDYSVDIIINKVESKPSDAFFNFERLVPFADYAMRTATGWNTFWTECGIADFSAEEHPDAKKLEGRLIEALYNITANTPGDWWLQAPLTVYGFAKQMTGDFKNEIKKHPEELCKRPEFIAAALLTLRAYVHPEVAKRFQMTQKMVDEFRLTIINAYAPSVRTTAVNLAGNSNEQLDGLDRNQLLSIAGQWVAIADSPEDNDICFTEGTLFHLPMATDFLNLPTLSPKQQQTLLFSIAARRWPAEWKVKVEDILTLP